jgi:hypothetical protein
MRFAMIIVLLLPVHAVAQAPTAQACDEAIFKTELTIAEARKKAEYRNDKGRYVLSTADRWVNQARKHAAAGENRSCVSAAQKARTQLSAR